MADVPGVFVWHELMTSDMAGAEKFYTNVMGWSASPYPDLPMPYTLFMAGEAPGGGLMNLPEDAAKMGAPPNWLGYLSVLDVDRSLEQAKSLGASVLAPPMSMPGVGTFAVLRDPQGAVFAIHKGEQPMQDETDPKPLTFSWHELATTDPEAAWKFYSTLFGWVEKDSFDMGAGDGLGPSGKYQMFGRDRFMYGGIYKKGSDMKGPPFWLHYVLVDDADKAAERATKAGGKIINGPMEVPGGDRIAVLMDPQGAGIAVHSRKK